MSLLRIFSGSNDKESRLRWLLNYVVAPKDKRCWMDISFSNHPNMILGNGITESATLDEMLYTFLLPHVAFGYPGKRLCYHCLIDFNGLLSPSDAGYVAWEINQFLLPYSVQFIQGVHVTKEKGTVFAPHVHTLINTITLFGPNAGRKFRTEKPVLRSYQSYMNSVLKKYGLPVIPCYDKGDKYEFSYTENRI